MTATTGVERMETLIKRSPPKRVLYLFYFFFFFIQLLTLIENPPAILALFTASVIDPELAMWLSFSITILYGARKYISRKFWRKKG